MSVVVTDAILENAILAHATNSSAYRHPRLLLRSLDRSGVEEIVKRLEKGDPLAIRVVQLAFPANCIIPIIRGELDVTHLYHMLTSQFFSNSGNNRPELFFPVGVCYLLLPMRVSMGRQKAIKHNIGNMVIQACLSRGDIENAVDMTNVLISIADPDSSFKLQLPRNSNLRAVVRHLVDVCDTNTHYSHTNYHNMFVQQLVQKNMSDCLSFLSTEYCPM